MRFVRISALAVLLAAFAVPAQAQENEFEQQVAIQMSVAEAFASSVGFALDDVLFSSLDQDGEESLTLNVAAGREYRLIAVCDNDCDDIDLYLEDADGNVIDEDISVDAAPVVSLPSATASGYRIRIKMYSCSVEPCYYAVGMFIR